MPCRSDGYDCVPEPTVLKSQYDKAVSELNLVTRLLCEVMGEVTKRSPKPIATSIELDVWWEKHQVVDKKRLERERIEKEIKKLNDKLRKLG